MQQIAPFSVSPRAASRINEIIAGEKGGPDKLRVAVLAGGCSGFQYKFELDGQPAADDVLIERDGARVLVDPASLDLLAGRRARLRRQADGGAFHGAQPERDVGLRVRDFVLDRLTG